MDISERIQELRRQMEEKKIDIYIVPSADYHQSEYVGDYFKAREFMTGFTGSAGTAVFTKDKAALWTDGRYFIQAAAQLADTEIHLQKIGEPGTPSVGKYIEEMLPEKGCIGFDGRTVGVSEGKAYKKIADKKNGKICCDVDLVGIIWKDRPQMPQKKAYVLDENYAGESVASKLKRVREKMQDAGADIHILTSLDDIGWLLNIRGGDVEYFPLLLSYAFVKMDTVELYADERKFDPEIRRMFSENQVNLHPYDAVYQDAASLQRSCTVMLDPERVNYILYNNIFDISYMVECENPTIKMKAVKNKTEVENIRKAHLKDGIAHTKFLYWLKNEIGKRTITEIEASDKLEEFRAQQEHFLGPSFDPISAYRDHAAIVHYSATKESNRELKPEGLLLMDTGGHYLEGSTDITRTIALGKLTEEEAKDFTLVAASMLNLADAVFPQGCTGMTLDYAARAPLWKKHKDFNHGTGHGVGYLGNIHEPPATINWKLRPGNVSPLEENMVITDEPGIYVENSHGIRTENELLVSRDGEAFLRFEILTLVPIDLDAILPEQLNEREKDLLNAYHKKVYAKIGPYLSKEEREWLKQCTKEIC